MGTIHNQDVHSFFDQARNPLVVMNADSGSHSQPPLPIFTGIGKASHHVDVFDRNKPC